MRHHIPHLETSSIPWNTPRPGTSAKLLSINESKPGSTVLLCFDPETGYEDQPSPHYHEGLEELLILSGRLSFDSRTWLHRGGYVFHPPKFVHGFKSKVPERTVLLARTEGPIESQFIRHEDALDDYPYFIGSKPSTRALAMVPSPWAFSPTIIESAVGKIRQFIYSEDKATSTITLLREYSSGSQELAPNPVSDGMVEEVFVLSGELTDVNGVVFKEGDFACFPAGTERPAFTANAFSQVVHSVFAD